MLTGGSAATVYAPQAYQSNDLDFVASFGHFKEEFDSILGFIGYSRETQRVYRNSVTPLSLEFPDDETMIGSDRVTEFATLQKEEMYLHILTPTDCIRDRLSSYFWFNSVSALKAAVDVAKAQVVDLSAIQDWADREGEKQKFGDFLRLLSNE